MNNYLQMVQFDFWLCLSVALFLFFCGTVGIIEDVKYKKCWWRWVLHILAIILSVIFVIWTV